MRTHNIFARFSNLLFVLLIYAFLYIPLVVLVLFSFNKAQFPAPWNGYTLFWYQELWQSTHVWLAFYTSCVVATSAVVISLLLGIGLMLYCMHSKRVAHLMNLFYVNLVIPEVVLSVGLLSLFALCSIPLGIPTLIISHTVLGVGYVVPILYVRFKSIDQRLIESSLDLGATTTQTFLRIILPLLRPSLVMGGLLVFILSFDDFVLSYFCAGSTAQTLSLYILSMLRSGISPVVNALSAILLLLSSCLVLIFCSLSIRSRLF